MHKTDIDDALASGRLRKIEDAFQALVLWPGYDTIEGSSAADRKDLLQRACEALENDGSIMPGGLADHILGKVEEMDGSSYADGARAVLGRPSRFFPVLTRQERS